MKKQLKMVSAALAACMLITGCSSGSSSSTATTTAAAAGETTAAETAAADETAAAAQESAEAKVLNFGCQMYDDGSVNTTQQISSSWNCMRYGISEALFKFNDNMEIEPWLAESYTVNDEHTEWVITLKQGIKFSDGCDLTATKVKECFEYIREMGPSGSAKPQKYLEYEAEITADDAANTVTIVTTQPYANLTGQLAYPVMAILDVEHTTDFDNGAIGTGPYKIASFNGVGVGYNMVANEYYREDVPYDEVNILFMGDASAKTMALQSGQVDLVENITNVTDIAAFQADDNYTVDIASGVRCGFTWMNLDGVLGNKTLRQAILMAIDYETICSSKTIGGLYTAGISVLPSTLSYGYDKLVNPYPYDPEGAKKLLDEAGIVDSDGDGWRELDGKKIDLQYVSYENRLLNDFSNAHMQYLAEIGICCTADFGSSDDEWNKLAAGTYDFNNNNWTTVGTGDPFEYMANWTTDGTYCGYSNPEYDALYEQLKSEMDSEKRADLIYQMQQIVIDDALVIVDGYYNSSMIYSKKVGYAHIHTADYYWLTTEITPAE